MSAKKKEVDIMCGSCHNDFNESKITLVTLHINPGDSKNGMYCRNLCEKCKKTEYYKGRILFEEQPRKFN